MGRNSAQRIADVLEAVERCRKYAAAVDCERDFAEMAEDAIERNLQVIGEAVNHLPDEITGAHPQIAWPQIRGFRNVLVHQYVGVDADGVRDVVVETHLPPLADTLRGRVRNKRPPCELAATADVIRLRNVVEFRFNV